MALADTARLIASLELQDKFSRPLAGATAGLGQAEARIGSLGRIGNEAGRGLSTAAANIAKIGIAAGGLAVTGIIASVKAASDLNETVSKVGVVFGTAAGKVLAFGETSAASLGLSKNAALSAAGTFGNLFVSMGLATGKSADMSTKLVTLAGDLASFNNLDPTEVLEKLRAGLTGESEPLKSLGININETILKAKALELGLIKTTASTAEITLKQQAYDKATVDLNKTLKKYGATSQEGLKATVKQAKAQDALEAATNKIPATLDAASKAQAAYALIFEQSATAQGDFARTSGGLANQQRILRANLENTGATIGTALLPKVAELAQQINKLVVDHQPEVERFAALLPKAFDTLIQFGGSLPWGAISSAFQLMGTGSKALLDAFLGLPPWVQTAVLTGWGLNKLTGGALGNIAGILTKAVLGGGIRGATPLNPVFVQQVGGLPGGGGGGLPPILPAAGGAAGLGIFGTLVAGALAAAAVAVVPLAIARQFSGDPVAPGGRLGFRPGEVAPVKDDPSREAIESLSQQAKTRSTQIHTDSAASIAKLSDIKSTISAGDLVSGQIRDATRAAQSDLALTALHTATAARLTETTLGPLNRIAAKEFSPTINVGVTATTQVSVSNIIRSVTSATIASVGSGPGGAIL